MCLSISLFQFKMSEPTEECVGMERGLVTLCFENEGTKTMNVEQIVEDSAALKTHRLPFREVSAKSNSLSREEHFNASNFTAT